jgi:hypothetical protein
MHPALSGELVEIEQDSRPISGRRVDLAETRR